MFGGIGTPGANGEPGRQQIGGGWRAGLPMLFTFGMTIGWRMPSCSARAIVVDIESAAAAAARPASAVRISRVFIAPRSFGYLLTVKWRATTFEVSKPWIDSAYSVCLPTAGAGRTTLQPSVPELIATGIGFAKVGSSSESSTDRLTLAV